VFAEWQSGVCECGCGLLLIDLLAVDACEQVEHTMRGAVMNQGWRLGSAATSAARPAAAKAAAATQRRAAASTTNSSRFASGLQDLFPIPIRRNTSRFSHLRIPTTAAQSLIGQPQNAENAICAAPGR
jgi:hypothetical protein